MNFFVPVFVHERECDWKRYETINLQRFQPCANYKWLNIVVFPHFLKCQVLFLQVLIQFLSIIFHHVQMYVAQLFTIMGMGVECMSSHKCISSRSNKYVCEQTINNYG
jgi:hypothetical protein